jgi:hypothetical protein
MFSPLERGMIVVRALGILFVLLIPTLAAADDKPPRLSAGEWQYIQLNDGGLPTDGARTICLADQSAFSKFDTGPN